MIPDRRTCLLMALLLSSMVSSHNCTAAMELRWAEGFPMRMGESVILMWLPVPGKVEYVIERTDLTDNSTVSITLATPQHVDINAPADKSFRYQIFAKREDVGELMVSEPKLLMGVALLGAPKSGSVFRQADSIMLAWDSVPEALYYNVYIAGDSGAASIIGSTSKQQYTNYDKASSDQQTYRIRAVSVQGEESADYLELIAQAVTAKKVVAEPSVIGERSFRLLRSMNGSTRYIFRDPADIAYSNGKLYLSDSGNYAIVVINAEGDIEKVITEAQVDYDGEWGQPWGLAVAPDGMSLVVTFLDVSRVRQYSLPDYELVMDAEIGPPREWKEAGFHPQLLDAIVTTDGSVWVSDSSYQQLIQLTPGGKVAMRVGEPRFSAEPGPFRSPGGLGYSIEDDLIVLSDTLSAAVFVIDSEGGIVARWNRFSEKVAPIALPKGLYVTAKNTVLLADGLMGSVVEYTMDGEPINNLVYDGEETLGIKSPNIAIAGQGEENIYILSKLAQRVYVMDEVSGN